MRQVVLARLEMQENGQEVCCVRGETTSAFDDVRIPMGPLEATTCWWDIPLPHCPDCRENSLEWAENGLVPGARKCAACGSVFSVDTEDM